MSPTIIPARTKDLGGFFVRRLLPSARCRMVGPWIFFDHMGMAEFAAGDGINVRPHPHINLATVTYLFEGEILHRDSLGSKQAIRPGDINLMIAGKGITHSERESDAVHNRAHRLHGLQLWHALPAKDEECAPEFIHYPSNDIPLVSVNGVEVRVMIGEAYSTTSPVKTFSHTLYCEAKLQEGQALILPDADELAIYVVEGELQLGEQVIDTHHMAVITRGDNKLLLALKSTHCVIIGGETFEPRYIEWNFVSSRQERIEQAKADWMAGNFPLVADDTEEYIPLPAA